MKTNQAFNHITIDSANRQKTRLSLAHDVNTTASIGDVQPLLCRQILPKSKAVLKYRHLLRLDPMVAPTYAELKAKTWNHFVGLSDLLPRTMPALLAKAPIAKGDLNSVPTVPSVMPHMIGCDLAAAILVGAQFTVYFHAPSGTEGPDSPNTYWRSYLASDTSTPVTDFKSWISSHLTYGVNSGFVGYSGVNLDLVALGDQFSSGNIPINCSGITSSAAFVNASNRFFYFGAGFSPYSWESVPLSSANYVLRTSFTENGNTYDICFAVRLSAFGKRIRKILRGLGFGCNLSLSGSNVDITPLFAYYKAYWDTFGLTLYDNWESSAANTILSAWDSQSLSTAIGWTTPYFKRFIYDLGTTFVTESQDYISAHQASDTVDSASGYDDDKDRGFLNNIILNTTGGINNGVSGISQISPSGALSSVNAYTGHVYINRTNHTEVDAQLLKTLYKWTNRQTVAGKRIAQLLEAGGYGDYVKNCKSNFIGYNEVDIDVSDINATADSTNAVTGQNSTLGAYVGKGVGVSQADRGDIKTFSFENDELGYWVTMFAIVPESGWCQGFDPVLLDIDVDHKYNPDFDGLGMELEPKLIVMGESDWAKSSYSSDFTASFGMVPRHTKYKVAHNIMNGDFNLRGVRDGNLPFVMDKYLSFGDREAVLSDSASYKYAVQAGSSLADIPIAGNAWRYLNRYSWLANFERIFAQNETNADLWSQYVRDMINLTNYELYYNVYDHVVCMNKLDLQVYSRVLPVSDSYGTTDENDGNGDMTMNKA